MRIPPDTWEGCVWAKAVCALFYSPNHPTMNHRNIKLWQVSEVRLSYHSKVQISDSPQITSSKDAANVLWANWSNDLELLESFNVLLLNRANRVKGIFTASKGGVSGTVVDAKIIFAAAIKSLACSIVISHNHPSGNLQPSKVDIDLTNKLVEAGKVLDVTVLDHLILTTEGYYSFADEGLI